MGSCVVAMDALGVRSNESTNSVIKSGKDYYVLITVRLRDKEKDRSQLIQNEIVGGRDGIRTRNPLLAKQVLSQLSYTPTSMALLTFYGTYAATSAPFFCCDFGTTETSLDAGRTNP